MKKWEWEWEGIGIDSMGMGGNGNVKSHSRSSLAHNEHAENSSKSSKAIIQQHILMFRRLCNITFYDFFAVFVLVAASLLTSTFNFN